MKLSKKIKFFILIGTLTLINIILFQNFTWTDSEPTSGAGKHPVEVMVDIDKWIATRNPSFFGTNMLYWIDTDIARSRNLEGKIVPNTDESQRILRQRYLELGIKRLRFPGGAVAENYDWKTNRLQYPDIFPYERLPGSDNFIPKKEEDQSTLEKKYLANRMDTLEFCAFKKSLGNDIDANFVVNTFGAFRKTNSPEIWNYNQDRVDKAILHAADWVKYVNLEHSSRCQFIRDWEIGNEVYFEHFTAKEYANLLIKYYEKMKLSDPRIRIGAIGPWDTREHEISMMDRLTDAARKSFRAQDDKYRSCSKEKLKPNGESYNPQKFERISTIEDFAVCMNDGFEPASMDKWWPTVAKIAKGKFDFIVTHKYDVRRQKELAGAAIPLKQEALNIQNMIKVATGQSAPVPMIMTEYNIGSEAAAENTAKVSGLAVAEMMVNYLSAGFEGANIWPARLPGNGNKLLWTNSNEGTKANAENPLGIATKDDMKILTAGKVFQFFNKALHWRLVESSVDKNSGLNVIASTNLVGDDKFKSSVQIVLVNRNSKGTTVTIPALNKHFKASIESFIFADEEAVTQVSNIDLRNEKFQVELPPESISKITVTLPPRATSATNQIVKKGDSVTFSVNNDTTNFTYKWRHDNSNIEGATGSSLTLNSVNPGHGINRHDGKYNLYIYDKISNQRSIVSFILTVIDSTSPLSQLALQGSSVTFAATDLVEKHPNLTYQWHHDNQKIIGANAHSLTLNSVNQGHGINRHDGKYSLRISNSETGQSLWMGFELIVFKSNITGTLTAKKGSTVIFEIKSSSNQLGNLMYEWNHDNQKIMGANTPSLSLNSVNPGHGINRHDGKYSLKIRDSNSGQILWVGFNLKVN